MEPLSGAASAIAVVSLSIQLIESVDRIKSFIKNVKGAPKELERLVGLLTRLAAILHDAQNMYVLTALDKDALFVGFNSFRQGNLYY